MLFFQTLYSLWKRLSRSRKPGGVNTRKGGQVAKNVHSMPTDDPHASVNNGKNLWLHPKFGRHLYTVIHLMWTVHQTLVDIFSCLRQNRMPRKKFGCDGINLRFVK